MKKLTGILGVVVLAMAMFFNLNTMNSSNVNFDLASLLTMNTANAEIFGQDDCSSNSIQDYMPDDDPCTVYVMSPIIGVPGTLIECHPQSGSCCLAIECTENTKI